MSEAEAPALRRLLPARRASDLLDGFAPLLGRLRVALADAAGEVLAGASGPDADGTVALLPAATWSLVEVPVATLLVGPIPDAPHEAALVELLRRTAFDTLEAAYARRSMAAETLERYREIHLLYRAGEALAGTLDPLEVPVRALAEARHVLSASSGGAWLGGDGEASEDAVDGTLRGPLEGVLVGEAAGAIGPTLAALQDPLHATVLGDDGTHGPRVWAPFVRDGGLRGGLLLARPPGAGEFAAGDAKLLAALATLAAAFLDLARLHRRALEQDRMQRELQLGFEVQERLLPRVRVAHPGWDVAAHWRPAREVSGDFYDAIELGDELGLVVADVADKGVPAALFMAVVRSLLRASAAEGRAPSDTVALTNRWACLDATDGTFVTLWYAQVTADGWVRYVNAGHNPPLVVRADGTVTPLARTGVIVGWDPDVPFGEASVQLHPGDLLVAFTDGVTEAVDPHGEAYGEARLLAALSRASAAAGDVRANHLVQALNDDLERFTAGADPFDDVTLLVVRRTDGAGA